MTTDQSASETTSEAVPQIGGWLILIALGLVVSVGGNVLNCLKLFRFLVEAQSLKGGIALVAVMLEVFIQLFMLCTSIVLVVLFFSRKWNFKRLFIAYIASLFCLGVVSVAIMASIPNVSPEIVGQAMAFPIYVLLLGAIWIPYFLRSKRVKATFVY